MFKYIITQESPTSKIDIIDTADSLEEAINVRKEFSNSFSRFEIDDKVLIFKLEKVE